MQIKKLCVFCGSSPGRQKQYAEAAENLGAVLAARKIELVYGGGRVGLMGTVARAVMQHGGIVTGVIPKHLADREVAFKEITSLKIVSSMHERKALMAKLSDAFVALPGGIGTFEEFFEMLTWTQLGLHTKPCALFNIRNYYGALMDFMAHAEREQFIDPESRKMIVVEEDPDKLIARLEQFTPPVKDKAKSALRASNLE
jgi:hypothetical protein